MRSNAFTSRGRPFCLIKALVFYILIHKWKGFIDVREKSRFLSLWIQCRIDILHLRTRSEDYEHSNVLLSCVLSQVIRKLSWSLTCAHMILKTYLFNWLNMSETTETESPQIHKVWVLHPPEICHWVLVRSSKCSTGDHAFSTWEHCGYVVVNAMFQTESSDNGDSAVLF